MIAKGLQPCFILLSRCSRWPSTRKTKTRVSSGKVCLILLLPVLTTATRCVVSTLQVLAPLADVASAGSGAKEAFEAAHEDDAIFPAFGRLMVHRHRLADLSKSIPRSSSHDASSSPTRSTDGDAHPNDDNATDLLIFMSPVLNRILPTTRTPSIKVAMTRMSPFPTTTNLQPSHHAANASASLAAAASPRRPSPPTSSRYTTPTTSQTTRQTTAAPSSPCS